MFSMHLSPDENILKTFYHHPLPLLGSVLGVAIASLPFFFVASFFQGVLNSKQMFTLYAGILALFLLVAIYVSVLYFWDRLIVTNKRIVHVDWKGLFLSEEVEADLSDIQDIAIKQLGLLTSFSIFNFGTFQVATASAKASIIFKHASNPEEIRNFIYHIQIKPTKIVEKGATVVETGFKPVSTTVAPK